VVARRVVLSGCEMVVEGSGPVPGELALEQVPGVPWRSYPVGAAERGWTARVPLGGVAGPAAAVVGERPAQWRFAAAVAPDAPAEPLATGPSVPEVRTLLDGVLLVAGPGDDGILRLCPLPPGPWVEEVRIRPDGVLVLAGALPSPGWPDLRVGLRPVEEGADLEVAADVAGDRWLAELPLVNVPAADWLPIWRAAAGAPAADLRFAARARRSLPLRTARARVRADAYGEVVTL
jgi:hypothetical protein